MKMYTHSVQSLVYSLQELREAKLHNEKFGIIKAIQDTVREDARRARQRILLFAVGNPFSKIGIES